MQRIVRQLERVRTTARLLLALKVLAQWTAALLVTAAACALADYLLRLPGWFRLLVDVIILVVAVRWLLRRWSTVQNFRPTLGDLALRAERLFPSLAGSFASGVEFTAASFLAPAEPPRTALLAGLSVENARRAAEGVPLRKLINPAGPLQAMLLAAAIAAACTGAVLALPHEAGFAALRWLTPLRDVQWPRRTEILSTTALAVHPTDQPLRFSAAIERGYRTGMRTWIHFRLLNPDSSARPWQALLMNDQAELAPQADETERGRFERLVDVGELLGPAAVTGWDDRAPDPSYKIEYYFTAGDDQSDQQSVMLVPRPTLRGASIDIEPPTYAQGLISRQTVQMDQLAGQMAAVAVREGSRVIWRLRLNKPIPDNQLQIANLMPTFPPTIAATASVTDNGMNVNITFTLNDSIETPIVLTDEYGLTNQSERRYRLTQVEDKDPSASMVQPSIDEPVLATARVALEAAAQDDVAIDSLTMEAKLKDKTTTLARITGRQARMDLKHELDLAPWTLSVGDEIAVTALTEDVFELDGRRHEAVRSSPRRLIVIDAVQMAGEIRNELSAVRQQAIRFDEQQRELMQTPAEHAASPQAQLTQRLAAKQSLLDTLTQRIERNRLDDPALRDTVRQGKKLLDDAVADSDKARQFLENAQRRQNEAPQQVKQAHEQQQQVSDSLVDLVELLDQGRDALTLQLQLQQLATMQEQLSGDTRAMLPGTAGKPMEQLTDEQKRQLSELAERQKTLAQRSQELAQQMQTTAEALQKPDAGEQEQAAGEALAEAAATAQRQGLSHAMNQASKSAQQNQLGEAGQSQARAQDIMKEMLERMGEQDKRRREILRRKLAELAEAIEQLVMAQGAEIKKLESAADLPALSEPLSVVRGNTMSVEDQAKAARRMEQVAGELGGAAKEQGLAIAALRDGRREPAQAGESASLAHLHSALKLVREMKNAAEQEQARKQREQLRVLYEQLAKQQAELRGQTQPFTTVPQLDRRQRADIVELGHREADLRGRIADAAGMGEQPMLFEHLHGKIDRAADEAARTLRKQTASSLVLQRQNQVESMLRMIAAALAEAQQEEQFENQSGESGGGGSEGGSANRPLIPPAAQLKLFRELQSSIHDRTRALNDGDATANDALLELSVEQRELAGLGERLIEQMRRDRMPRTIEMPREPRP